MVAPAQIVIVVYECNNYAVSVVGTANLASIAMTEEVAATLMLMLIATYRDLLITVRVLRVTRVYSSLAGCRTVAVN